MIGMALRNQKCLAVVRDFQMDGKQRTGLTDVPVLAFRQLVYGKPTLCIRA
jgi:hypothetical protein